ncbi:hypothetical protein SETIT_6G063800v2 [Setaria italica]|uniref:Uncharacterized protein n=1 Tax=Setaria italica TaxID=4555 RepID=A0A368RKD6_SETIT|nr:hypothetical protein SETIT_6G063800v2 [Setaria italica]
MLRIDACIHFRSWKNTNQLISNARGFATSRLLYRNFKIYEVALGMRELFWEVRVYIV